MSQDLTQQLANNTDYVSVTLDLYDGRLVQYDGRLYFIAERFGGWEVIEQASLTDIERVETVENFMGIVTEIRGRGVRWQCKNLPEGTDLNAWLFRTQADLSMDLNVITSEATSISQQENPEVIAVETSQPPPLPVSPTAERSISSDVLSSGPSKEVDPYLEEREHIERLRTMLNSAPMVLRHVRRMKGTDFNPNDDATLAEIVRSQPQLIQQLEQIDSLLNMGMATGGDAVLDVSEPTTFGGRIKKLLSLDGLPLPMKIFKGFAIFWVGTFILQFTLGILIGLGMVLSTFW